VFWQDIELSFIIIVQLILLVADVWTKDESALLEKYIDKTEMLKNKDIDVTDKSMIDKTVMTTKGDMLSYRENNELLMPRNSDEHDMLRNAVYHELSKSPYTNQFQQNIKVFNQLIHEDKQEDVMSNYSETMEPRKMVKDLNPFQDKYDDRAKGFKGLYTSVKKPNMSPKKSPTKDPRYHEYNYRTVNKDSERSRRAGNHSISYDQDIEQRETTRNISGNPIDSNSKDFMDLNHEKSLDSYLDKKQKDPISRMMMNTVNPSKKQPYFNVEIETNGVMKARRELREEIDKESELQEEQILIDSQIKELNDKIKNLEKEKFKLKLNRKSAKQKPVSIMKPVVKQTAAKRDSRATQYLRSDLINENSADGVTKENVKKSIEIEGKAEEWLHKSRGLSSALANRQSNGLEQSDEEISSDYEDSHDVSSQITKKKY
jgi:hypothetical protein